MAGIGYGTLVPYQLLIAEAWGFWSSHHEMCHCFQNSWTQCCGGSLSRIEVLQTIVEHGFAVIQVLVLCSLLTMGRLVDGWWMVLVHLS